MKTHYQGENSWLLIKHNDKYATDKDITEKNKSVISKKTIEQVEKTSDKIWKSNREQKSSNSKSRAVKGKKIKIINTEPAKSAKKKTKSPSPTVKT